MAKKFMTILIALITLVFLQSNVWAATHNTTPETQIYSVTSTDFFADDATSIQLAAGKANMSTNQWFWLASIPIAGLGQILMGDTARGLKFLIPWAICYAIGAVGGVALTALLAPILGGLVGLVWTAVYLVGAVFWVWGIIDAWQMSQEMMGMSKIDFNKFATENGKVSYSF